VTDQGRQAVEVTEQTAHTEQAGEPDTQELAGRLTEAEDRYRRALADLDNYRKRSARDADRRVADATDALLLQWLDALDSIERGMRMQGDAALTDGMRAVLGQMEAVLTRAGATRMGDIGEAFDPEAHEAVGVQTTPDMPDRTIFDVARSGFRRDGRVLRPAQVIVSRAPERPEV
jgi:molecular chaperone GrpE